MRPRYTRSPDVLWRRTGDAVVMLPLAGGEVMDLSGTGRALWDLLVDPIDLEEATDSLARLFSAPSDVVRRDVEPVLRALLDRSLISAVDEG